jgi:site-specific recombinase
VKEVYNPANDSLRMLAATPFQIEDLLALDPSATRARATWMYEALRFYLHLPTARRTERLQQFAAEIDFHPKRQEIREILRDFWSHHSYVRVITESGLPDEVFLLRELLSRALRHLIPVDEVQGDLYVLLDSLNLREADAQWVASLPDSFVNWWADIFRPSAASVLVSSELLALRATNLALARDFLTLADDEHVAESSFFTLPALVEHVGGNPEEFPKWEARREACEGQLREATLSLEERGASASMVFRVRLLRPLLWRIQQVLNLRRSGTDSRSFAVSIVHGFASQRKISTVVSVSTRRLARSVVEKTGRASTISPGTPRNGRSWVGARS